MIMLLTKFLIVFISLTKLQIRECFCLVSRFMKIRGRLQRQCSYTERKMKTKICCMTDFWQVFKAFHCQVKVDQKRNSIAGEPSFGRLQPGYWLQRSRVRIPHSHLLITVVDVPYWDSFKGIVAGDFPVLFVLELQLFTKWQASSTINRIQLFKLLNLT